MEMQVDFSIFSYIFSKFRRECPQNFRKSEESTGVKAQKNTAHSGGVFRSVYCAFYTKISCFCSGSTRCSKRGDRREARREPCTPYRSWRR